MSTKSYHEPVLLQESIEGLNIKENGIYVDVTFGGGGHSKEILKHIKGGRLIAFDQDQEAIRNKIKDERITMLNTNFSNLQNSLQEIGISAIDGLLADLGVSSHQFDSSHRGFSFRFESELDMRMNQQQKTSALDIIQTYSAEKLQQVFSQYGEIRNSRTLAHTIIIARSNQKILTTKNFIDAIRGCIPFKHESQYLAQVFQAMRIEVNGELDALKALLEQSAEVIKKGGRLVVISYHSLEDRLVKNFIAKGNFEGQAEKDFYGNVIKPFSVINKKPIDPSEEEVKINSRSRSARLRIAEKN